MRSRSAQQRGIHDEDEQAVNGDGECEGQLKGMACPPLVLQGDQRAMGEAEEGAYREEDDQGSGGKTGDLCQGSALALDLDELGVDGVAAASQDGAQVVERARLAISSASSWRLLAPCCSMLAALALVPPVPRHEIRPLSPDEACRFVEAVGGSGERDEALYVLAIRSGMRQGEMLGLRWRDVDLEH